MWEIDLDLLRYRRWPKAEGPREEPFKSYSDGTKLEDLIWHDCTGAHIDLGSRYRHAARTVLIIDVPDEHRPRQCIIAPNPIVHRGDLEDATQASEAT
jgi:hypothetical protein